MYCEMICIEPIGKLKKGLIYPITGVQGCCCGKTSVSFGMKHGYNLSIINNTCPCGRPLQKTDEYWALINHFAEIDQQTVEAVEELKESLELVEVI